MVSSAVTDAPARPSFGFARRNGATVVGQDAHGATVAHRAGVRPEVIAELRRHCGVPLRLQAHEPAAFERLLRDLYEGGTDDAQAMVADFDGNLDLAQLADALPEPTDLLESDDDAPIIRLINALLTQAVKENASDIHIEPFENRLVVRYRIDGVLREVLSPQKAVAQPVVSRIKVMAKLDIAEKRLPQDGRIGLRIAGRPVDVRVSTIPAGHGERVVLRLLDKQAGRLDLSQLGMAAPMREQIDALIHRPHGIVLVTGPTGSGKTTTLYAALTRLNDATRNILTVEDPIEYYLDGVGQTQVNPKVDMTFARGLRAILRQDPDVVMVGEIRDLETAEIAIKAAQTGHMVLSTLHTNDAPQTISRLMNMGIAPYNITSSVTLVIAQRLARRLHDCKRAMHLPEHALLAEGFTADEIHAGITVFEPVGCEDCTEGYKGRVGIYQVMPMTDRIQQIVLAGGNVQQITEAALQSGVRDLRRSALDKVKQGVTSLVEINRVTKD